MDDIEKRALVEYARKLEAEKYALITEFEDYRELEVSIRSLLFYPIMQHIGENKTIEFIDAALSKAKERAVIEELEEYHRAITIEGLLE